MAESADRAVVLGSGGVTGVAWLVGMIAGLAEAGVDLRAADLVVGTSAGSSAGVQLTSDASIEQLYAAQLAETGPEAAARMGAGTTLRLLWSMLRSRDPQRFRARTGALALAAATEPEAERRAVLASRLPANVWPRTRLLITAVDARTGEFVVFDRDAGVPLLDAVAASCAVPGVWPPATIGGRRYVDGGMRSPVNADLAAGSRRIVALAPLTRGIGPITPLARQVRELRAQGATVVVVSPDEASRRAIGRNVLDPGRRGPAAQAGRAQAATVAAAVAAAWSR
jgi:NTE family protein